MAQLKTDYKDQLLDTSVNTQRKYRQVDNGDGTISLVDETEYTQQGDTFGAGDVNAIAQAVNDCFQSVSNGKALVASAITDKGVSTDATATFEQMASNISNIVVEPVAGNKKTVSNQHASDSGGGTASASPTISLPANGKYIVTFVACQSSSEDYANNSSLTIGSFSKSGTSLVENAVTTMVPATPKMFDGATARLYSQSILVSTGSSDVNISRTATAGGYGGNIIATIYAIRIG